MPAHGGSKGCGQCVNAQPVRQGLGKQRQQADGCQRFQGERTPHAPPGQPVKRQVDGKENQAEIPTSGVVQPEGDPRRPACQQAHLFEHQDPQRDKNGASEQGLQVFGI